MKSYLWCQIAFHILPRSSKTPKHLKVLFADRIHKHTKSNYHICDLQTNRIHIHQTAIWNRTIGRVIKTCGTLCNSVIDEREFKREIAEPFSHLLLSVITTYGIISNTAENGWVHLHLALREYTQYIYISIIIKIYYTCRHWISMRDNKFNRSQRKPKRSRLTPIASQNFAYMHVLPSHNFYSIRLLRPRFKRNCAADLSTFVCLFCHNSQSPKYIKKA